ncbi:ribonuclease III [Oceanibacterium hippocampi]|uniref:Ribonuclease 3 n=1 Tax=Oceanibacterium hippocampi TaxID=745714 RepID=A0A1Y5U2I6_9PROT|nr:ribonuclease III [Oceanibacterium hippocampi]SLN77064.1 Ribonuclease 3 [Oceanibacterium hippocampi]
MAPLTETPGDFAALQETLGHRFADQGLLREAVSHSSLQGSESGGDYERLEFLGDRVLGLVITTLLFERHPSDPAGDLAPRLNALVRRESLAAIALEIGLGQHIRMATSEAASGGREKPAILADCLEAVIGALFLDGGMDVARRFIIDHWQSRLEQSESTKDPKTLLQELAHRRGLGLPEYRIVSTEGPPHEPVFTVEVKLGERRPARATGLSKRKAEQAAAQDLLGRIDHD